MDGLVLTQIAGWSSPVARRAHNPKVASSNLAPATKSPKGLPIRQPLFFNINPIWRLIRYIKNAHH